MGVSYNGGTQQPRGFPTKNDHFGVLWGYHHLRKHPYLLVGTSQTSKLWDSRTASTLLRGNEDAPQGVSINGESLGNRQMHHSRFTMTWIYFLETRILSGWIFCVEIQGFVSLTNYEWYSSAWFVVIASWKVIEKTNLFFLGEETI